MNKEYTTHSSCGIFSVFRDSRTKDYWISNEYGENYWVGEIIDLIEMKELLEKAVQENKHEIRAQTW